MEDRSKPAVRAWPYKTGYMGQFRKPGGAWQFVRGEDDKSAAVFPTTEAAKDAARDLIFEFMCPPIRTTTEREAPEPMAEKLVSEIGEFRDRRERQQVEDRRVFQGLGKGFVDVQVVKRRLL